MVQSGSRAWPKDSFEGVLVRHLPCRASNILGRGSIEKVPWDPGALANLAATDSSTRQANKALEDTEAVDDNIEGQA